MGPNTALALGFSGILGIYLECLRPGYAIAGCLGAASLLWGGYQLWFYRPTVDGCSLLIAAILLFILELARNTRFAAAISATVALCLGLNRLLPSPHQLNRTLAACISVALGAVTTLACTAVREARRNKRSDLY